MISSLVPSILKVCEFAAIEAARLMGKGNRKEADQAAVTAMRRALNDVIRLTKEKANFRLCKGIYVEPKEIAYKKRDEIRENFLKALEIMLKRGAYVGIATHDNFLIEKSKKMIEELNIPKEKYEFQMLLGVKENLRNKLVKEGYKMRIYVPFGIRWYQYSMRRFKENPNIAGQVLKALITFRR